MPDEVPVGEVEVIVLASSSTATVAQQTLDELFAELDRMPHKRLTKDEINQYLAGEWESWDCCDARRLLGCVRAAAPPSAKHALEATR